MGLNNCQFIGNLGRDPESAVTTKSNMKVTKFPIGVNEKYKDQESTTWINVVTFDKLAEITAQYLRKGQLVFVMGRLQVRQYDRQDGTKGTSVDLIANQVVFLEKKSAVEPQSQPSSSVPDSAGISDDDTPF
jgi:single-strand DNA-binding protein